MMHKEEMEPPCKRMRLQEPEKLRMECVLGDSLVEDVELVKVCVGRILDKKHTRSIILDLNAKHPIPSLSHLKRIKKDRIIVCLGDTTNGIDRFLEELKIDSDFIGDFEILEVARKAPITRRQFESANEKWPCNFHENKSLERLVNNAFSSEELDLHEKWMRAALEVAKDASRCSASIVVDPSSDMMIGQSADDRHNHPMHHSVMLAVDMVARSQQGGAWPQPSFGKCTPVPLIPIGDDSPNDGSYLCTGYDVYTTREPCIMCGMALIHSRAKRVFYGSPSKNGSLGTIAKIHALKDLNHHYEVFRGLLREDCDRLAQSSLTHIPHSNQDIADCC